MIALPAYFDGNTVRTVDAYPFQKDQRLIITVLDGAAWKAESADTAPDFDTHFAPPDRQPEISAATNEQEIAHRLAGLQKYHGRLPADFDAEKELAAAREEKASAMPRTFGKFKGKATAVFSDDWQMTEAELCSL